MSRHVDIPLSVKHCKIVYSQKAKAVIVIFLVSITQGISNMLSSQEKIICKNLLQWKANDSEEAHEEKMCNSD